MSGPTKHVHRRHGAARGRRIGSVREVATNAGHVAQEQPCTGKVYQSGNRRRRDSRCGFIASSRAAQRRTSHRLAGPSDKSKGPHKSLETAAAAPEMAVAAVLPPVAPAASAGAAPHPDPAVAADNLPAQTDPAQLATRHDIEQRLAQLSARESTLDERLEGLITSRGRLATQLRTLESLRHAVHGIHGEAEHMANEVAHVAESADRVGAKVRTLDEEQVRSLLSAFTAIVKADIPIRQQSRVKECIDMVQAVQDLKSAIAALDAAMQNQDWESATRSMQRAMAIDSAVVSSGFAEAVVVRTQFILSG